MDGFITEANMKQRQKHETFYRLNGAIYLWKTKSFLRGDKLCSEGAQASVMEVSHSVDIDTNIDFIVAEAIISEKK